MTCQGVLVWRLPLAAGLMPLNRENIPGQDAIKTKGTQLEK
jgi:hypothetical protein